MDWKKETNLKETFNNSFISAYKEITGFNDKLKCFKENKDIFEALKNTSLEYDINLLDFHNEVNGFFKFEINFNEGKFFVEAKAVIVEKVNNDLELVTKDNVSDLYYSFSLALEAVLGKKAKTAHNGYIYFDLNDKFYLRFNSIYIE